MDPVQWSNVKREIQNEHLHAKATRKKLVYSQLKEGISTKSGPVGRQEPIKLGS